MQNTRSASPAISCRWGSSAGEQKQDRGLPGGLLEGLGQVANHLLGILIEQRVMLRDPEAVVVLLHFGHEGKRVLVRRTSLQGEAQAALARGRDPLAPGQAGGSDREAYGKVNLSRKGWKTYSYWMDSWREGGKTRNVHLGAPGK
jgi:hypothetical protein